MKIDSKSILLRRDSIFLKRLWWFLVNCFIRRCFQSLFVWILGQKSKLLSASLDKGKQRLPFFTFQRSLSHLWRKQRTRREFLTSFNMLELLLLKYRPMLRLRGERSCSKWFSHFQKFLHWDRFLANDYFAIRDCLDKFGRIHSVNYLIGIIFLICPDVNMRDISGFVQAFFFKGYILQKLNVIILVKISFHWHFQKLGPHY